MVKALTPQEAGVEAKKLAIEKIPSLVLKASNYLLAANLTKSGHAEFNQNQLIDKILELVKEDEGGWYENMTFDGGKPIKSLTRHDIFRLGWLDIEEAYEAQGWSCVYDKPGYNEDYIGFWKFKAK